MSTFIFAYRAPLGYAPRGDVAAAWNDWFKSLGESLLDVGNPVFERTVIGSATSDTDLAGYSIVEAEDLAAARSLAEGCPFLRYGGAVEVGVLTRLHEGSLLTSVEDHARANQLVG